MHGDATRTTNLLGALALEANVVQEEATRAVLGQGGAAAAALVTIAAFPGRTIEQLRGPLGLSQPGAVRLVERLVEAGWVVRSGAGGRRGFELRLSAAGRQAHDELLAARRAALAALLEPLSRAERSRLAGLLEMLLADRTRDRLDLERLCRLCERSSCSRCPVARALA